MDKMRGDNGQQPDKNGSSGRMNRILRTASFWALLVLIPVAILQLMNSARGQQEALDYTEFRAELDAGNIQSVTITEGVSVEGRLKRPIQRDEAQIDRFQTRLPTELSEELEAELRAQNVQIEARPAGNNWVNILVGLLPWILIIGLWLFVFRQMQAGGSRAFSFGKSKARLLSGDTPKVTFADVAGCDEAKDELQEIIEFLKDPQKFSRLGGRLPKGALLVGPPGTGKTLLARAVAGEAGRPFFSMSGSDFVEMFVGVGASVTGDTPVLVRDDEGSRLVPIGEYVDGVYDSLGVARGEELDDRVMPVFGTETLGYESDETGFRGDLEVFGGSAWRSVKGVYRHRVDEIYEVEYPGGTIRTTGDHSVFVRRHGGIRPIAVRDLEPGDVLVDLPRSREGAAEAFRVSEPAMVGASASAVASFSEQNRPARSYAPFAVAAAGISPQSISAWRAGLPEGTEGAPPVREASTDDDPTVRRVIRKPYDGYVYDLCGCENEAFFGGSRPVLLHNSRVRDLFEQGKAHAPCIIFIDEIDAVGRHRGAGLGGGHDEREQTLNQLLVEMDGFESNEGVILLAATNRPDVLDPALLRPGRFDRQIVVDNPDVKGREGIFRVHTQDIPLAEDVDLGVLAKGTPGLSGADIENVVNEAALLAAREDEDRVYMDQFERAKDKVMLGTERRSMVISEEERKVTAYHEAGHAVIALRVPGLDPLHKVTIVPRGRALGITASLPEEDRHNYTKDWLEGQLKMMFGGRVAEEMTFGEGKITTGAGNDIERATGLARRMVTQFGMSPAIGPMAVGDQEQEVFLGRDISHRREVSGKTAELVDAEIKRILDESYEATRQVLEENSELLESIAEALLERETLDVDDIELLEKGEPLPPADIPMPASPSERKRKKETKTPIERPIEGAGGEPAPAPA